MSATTDAPARALPLLYTHVVGVNPKDHGQLRLDRSVGYAYAGQAQSVPLGLSEFESACQHMPILFTTGAAPVPVALLALGQGQNLFVDPTTGAWLRDAYVPSYLRAYPFIFIEDAARQTTFIGVEAEAPVLSPDRGARLFEDGKPTPALSDAVGFCTALRDNMAAAAALGRALDAAGLLSAEEANVSFTAGGTAVIRGFKVVKPERLDAVDAALFLEWRRRGWLPAIYAHMYSAARWSRLIELAAARWPAGTSGSR